MLSSFKTGGIGVRHEVKARLVNADDDDDPDPRMSVKRPAAIYRELNKQYWGRHLWARVYFAATTGIVGASVVTMGMLATPVLLKHHYKPELAVGSVCAGGSLGIGFAIPVSTVKTVMESIISKGHVVRGWIGVEPRDITPELAENLNLSQKSGVIIAAILKNGPADRAGMKPGDILLSVGDKPIANMSEMFNMIALLEPGSQVGVTVSRNGKERPLAVTVGKRPSRKRLEEQSGG